MGRIGRAHPEAEVLGLARGGHVPGRANVLRQPQPPVCGPRNRRGEAREGVGRDVVCEGCAGCVGCAGCPRGCEGHAPGPPLGHLRGTGRTTHAVVCLYLTLSAICWHCDTGAEAGTEGAVRLCNRGPETPKIVLRAVPGVLQGQWDVGRGRGLTAFGAAQHILHPLARRGCRLLRQRIQLPRVHRPAATEGTSAGDQGTGEEKSKHPLLLT